jgi:hypothetical protein
MPNHNGLHVPLEVDRCVQQINAEHRARTGRYPPTHPFAGSDPARAGVGLPGHCEPCAVVGHVAAHPDYGCGDVHCRADH